MINFCDAACEIVQATSDGNDLAPPDMRLLQAALNRGLTELGERAFQDLHQRVMAGKYTKPFLHGIEHLTQDHEGYVYWKGTQVEHYSFRDPDQEKAAAERLAADCRSLESKGFPVNSRTAISREVIDAPKDTPWIDALCSFYAIFAKGERIRVVFYRKRGQEGVVVLEKSEQGALISEPFTGNLDAYNAYHAQLKIGFESQGPYKTYEQLESIFRKSGITPKEIKRAIS